jgi:hypothetical protein
MSNVNFIGDKKMEICLVSIQFMSLFAIVKRQKIHNNA